MRVVVAPDKFKGSLGAAEVAAALAAGLRAGGVGDVAEIPVADGGEGTVDAAVEAGFTRRTRAVTGPVGEPVEASYAVRGAAAVVEMAQASGIDALPRDAGGDPALDSLGATSLGTGELIADALDAGATTIVLGVGGSACTDGGAGMLRALGARLLDADGRDVGSGGAALRDLARVDLAGLHSGLAGADVVLAADVDNPLLGERGAAAVFAPQKGAGPRDVAVLERGLAQWRDRLADALGQRVADVADRPGAGAAGGVGFAALAVLRAVRRPGIDVVLEFVDLAGQLIGADLVLTGEGSLDAQSLGGKAPMGVLRVAREAGVPVELVCGRSLLGADEVAAAGFRAVRTLADLEPDPRVSMREAAALLARVGETIAADLRGGAPAE